MTAPRRGRGRPALFAPEARRLYLEARAAGATQKTAAAAAGVAERTVRAARQHDPDFRAADDEVWRTRGRQARIDQLPHDESRYTNHACRCDTCRKHATTNRLARPDRAPTPEAPVVPINPPDTPPHQGSSEDFPLAAAS